MAPNDLCAGIAKVTKRVCTAYVDPSRVAPLLASHLVALDKHQTICLIDIGETFLHKQAFRDATCLGYGWSPDYYLTVYACGKAFSLSHAFSCPRYPFPSIMHNLNETGLQSSLLRFAPI